MSARMTSETVHRIQTVSVTLTEREMTVETNWLPARRVSYDSPHQPDSIVHDALPFAVQLTDADLDHIESRVDLVETNDSVKATAYIVRKRRDARHDAAVSNAKLAIHATLTDWLARHERANQNDINHVYGRNHATDARIARETNRLAAFRENLPRNWSV